MKIKFVLGSVLAAIGLLTATGVNAQSTETRWSGTNVNSLSKATNSDSGVTGGEWFLLYNVGTGKFLINGGDWGAEGRLFYDDWGKLLKYTNDNLIYTGMETATGAWFWGANVPQITSGFSWTNGDETFYTLMDARKAYSGTGSTSGTRSLIFTPVETSGEVFTYYISERLGNNTYYLGAAWGEFRDTRDTSRDHGSFVFIDDDRAVWTSENVPTKTDEVEIFGGTTVAAKELYQWRIVTLEQFEAQVLGNSAEAYGGLSANVSYRITDQDFSRNIVAFFNGENPPSGTSDLQWEAGWNVTSNATGSNGRYKYTWGWVNDPKQFNNQESNQCDHLNSGSRYVNNQAWDYPVRLKEQFVHDGTGWQKKDCKNGFLSFEGTGTVSSWITAPATGYYQVKCVGFSQSTDATDAHRGYLFASVKNATSGEVSAHAQTYLYQMPAGTYDRTTYAQTLAVGNELRTTQDGGTYQSMVQIYAEKDQRIYIGVGKDASTQSAPDYTTGGTTTTVYYYSTTVNGTTYYLKAAADGTVSVVTEKSEATQWLTSGSGNTSTYIYCTINGTQYWLRYENGTPKVGTSTSASNTSFRTILYNSSINAYRSNIDVYLQYSNSNLTWVTSSSSSGVFKRTSDNITTGGTNYYHDTDWVAVDNFQIIFLGDQGPVIFDEDESESLDYLKKYESTGNFNNRTVWLKRTMMQNQWNSFVFPLDLTNAQVRNVFGDDVKLAKLHGLGTLSGDPGIIDFQSVNLGSDGTAITAGDFYIIQPTKAPTTNAATGEKYYTIGRRTFTLSALPSTHSTTVTDKSGNLHISAYATYVNGGQAPIHSYVLGTKSGEDEIFMYYLSKATNMKGFRGYLIDEDGALGSKSAGIFLGGFFDDETLYIDGLHNHKPTSDGYIYDMMGRKVGKANETSTDNLPKGLYIMNGKKFIVK